MYEKNGVRLIDVLVEKTPQELLPKIIPSDVRQDMEVAMIIKLGGKEQKEIKFESIVAQLEDEYLNGKRRKYDQLPLTKEQEELLDKFKSIMSDGKAMNDCYNHYLQVIENCYQRIAYLQMKFIT